MELMRPKSNLDRALEIDVDMPSSVAGRAYIGEMLKEVEEEEKRIVKEEDTAMGKDCAPCE
jgi:hypothetical protein